MLYFLLFSFYNSCYLSITDLLDYDHVDQIAERHHNTNSEVHFQTDDQ